ncbi:MAG TPA: UDP-glucose 4-epimerase GalE [bacterium]|nr:UDP-glucose 4-epimerase GalE [bacterium]
MTPVKTILISGGAGYIGSHAVKEAPKFGFRPVVYDNLSAGHAWAVKGATLVKGDLSNLGLLRRTFAKYRPAAVMHFASHIAVGESVVNPQKYYRDNLTNAMALLSVMLEKKVGYFILSSTAAVYGDPVKVPMPETHPTRPVNPYGDSKWMLERILAWYDSAYGLKSTFLRYFNAAGAYAGGGIGEVHEPESHLIPLVLDAALGRRKAITVFGEDYPTPDGTCIRDYIHVTDLAAAHFLALKRMMRLGESGVFNLGTGRGYSVRQVIRTAEKVTGRPIPVVRGKRRAGDPPRLVASSAKARRVLGWKPKYSSLENILKTAWEWHKSYFGEPK